MKNKFVIICLINLLITSCVNAQNPNNKPVFDPAKGVDKGPARLPTTNQPDWVEVYEQPFFRGAVAKYAGNITNFEYPTFPLSTPANRRNISLKVAPGYIAYISYKEDNSAEVIVFGDRPNFGRDNRADIKSIRVVRAQTANLNLSGIGTQIHNNDCKRIFGTIKVKIFERKEDGSLITCPLVERYGILLTEREINDRYNNQRSRPTIPYDTANLFSRYNSFPNHSFYDGSSVNFDGTTVPQLNSTFLMGNGRAAGLGFLVSEQALSEDRIVMEIITELGVQHKSGDLATDYSSNVKMQRPVKTIMNYQSAPEFFSIGDGSGNFIAQGNPNNNYGMASGVKFSITKQLRVFLNKERTPGPVRRN